MAIERARFQRFQQMAAATLNLRELNFLVADASKNFQTLVSRILLNFGAGKVMDAYTGPKALDLVKGKKVDVLFCDVNLPELDGFDLTKTIRADATLKNRAIPIFVLTSHTQANNVHRARDSGANLVVAKPVSPNILFDRLLWVAKSPRPFVETEGYFGPDRRFKIEGFPDGVGRREEDSASEVSGEDGPAMSQDEIDNMFT